MPDKAVSKDLLRKITGEKGNALRYRIAYTACLIVHSFYAILFFTVGVAELGIFNIFSSVMYLLGFLLIKENKLTVLWMILLNAEIIAHGILCGHFVGYQYQFMLFSLAVIPVTYFITYLDPAFKHPIIFSSVVEGINGIGIMLSLYLSGRNEPVYNGYPREFVNDIALINMLFALVLMISFSVMFTSKISYDMKKLMAQNDKLDYLANYDQLTGLRNRNHIRELFWNYIISKEPYCVILGDIDDFKHVNDTYGHNAGDDVLKTVAGIIRDTVGSKGIPCRWGGEEILIILKGTTESCRPLAEEILRNIRSVTVKSGGRRIKVTMTFGISDHTDAMNIEKLISVADSRLYKGKKSGKNRVVSDG